MDNVVHHGGLPAHAVGGPIVFVHDLSRATTWWAKNLAVLGQRAVMTSRLSRTGRRREGPALPLEEPA